MGDPALSIGSSVLLTQRAEKLAGGTLSIHISVVNSHALALATAAQEDVLFMHAAGALPTDAVGQKALQALAGMISVV